MRRALLALVLLSGALALGSPGAAGSASPERLRLDGIGPLKLGMTRAAALRTGWLAHRQAGCPLVSPVPVTYTLTGDKAPAGVSGSAEFVDGRLQGLSFTRGVRTKVGVTVGVTTLAGMAKRYRRAGYAASTEHSSTFAGTFVGVTRKGQPVIGGFGTGRRVSTLAIPSVPVCE